MNKFDNYIRLSENRSSWGSVLLILGLSLVGFMIVGPLIGVMIAIPFYEGNIMEMGEAIANPLSNPDFKLPLYIIQGTATLIGLIIVPLIYLKSREQKSIAIFFKKPIGYIPLLLTVIVVITFMFFNAIFIEWNSSINFPEFMKGFEDWARDKEEMAQRATEYLTTFGHSYELIVAFIVVGILPAVGEELVFRGLLQNEIHHASGNIHIGIWVSAILFSTIHFQFFGFVPRLFLGALFGYLYYWSGNLWIPILAHLVNNGFTLIMLYLHQEEIVDFGIENTEAIPLPTALIFTIITVGLLFYFRNYFVKRSDDEGMARGI